MDVQERGPPIDDAVLRQVRHDLGEDGFEELLGIYLDESRRLMDEMRRGLTAGDRAIVKRGGHTLRSTSAIFGLSRLSGLMGELEKKAATASPSALEGTLREAEAEYAEAVRRLRDAAPPGPQDDRAHWM